MVYYITNDMTRIKEMKKIYSDDNIPTILESSGDYSEWHEKIKKGDVVVIEKPNVVCHNLIEFMEFLDMMYENGCRVIVKNDIDSGNAMGKLFVDIAHGLLEFSRKEFCE